jgi:hypothetical protein
LSSTRAAILSGFVIGAPLALFDTSQPPDLIARYDKSTKTMTNARITTYSSAA